MEKVLSIIGFVNEKIIEFGESKKPNWAKDKSVQLSERYANAYLKNETWLNSVEALLHRYGVNKNESI